MRRASVVGVLISLLVVAGGQPFAANEASVKLRMAVNEPQGGGPKPKALAYFADEVKKRSQGKIEIVIGWSESFVKQGDMTTATADGIVQLASPSVAAASTLAPALNVFTVPMFFRSSAEYLKLAQQTDAFSKVEKDLEDKNLVVLGWGDYGAREICTSKKEVKTAADLKGMKIRTQASPAIVETWKNWGVIPVAMGAGEVPTALESGVIDGIDFALTAIKPFGLQDFVKFITISDHSISPEFIIVNKAAFEKLSPDQRKILRESTKAAVAEWENAKAAEATTIVADLQKAKIQFVTLSGSDRAKLAAAAKPVIDREVAKYPSLQYLVKVADNIRK